MKKYNDTTYAILGILTTECKSGYAIKQFIESSLSHFWKISYGQLYPTLKLITEDNLAVVRTAAHDGKPDKNEYYLTEKGIEVLKSWLEQPIEQIPNERNEVLLKLYFGSYQSHESRLSLLDHYKQELEKRYDLYVSIEQSIIANNSDNKDSFYWILTLDFGKRKTKAALEWCQATLEKLNIERKNH